MNRLLVVIWLAVVALVAVVTGCDRAPRYDSRLVAADSLMQPDPDSALALVQAVAPGSLTGEADSAYHRLLLTQGRYRCYVTATSDSDINCALAYYRRHDGEREKLTRAFIYKGAVMEELGHSDSAMVYYKTAETTAAPDDYFNLGYVNLRMGELYQNFNAPDSIILMRMRKARDNFHSCGDTSLLITATGTMGTYLHNTDSAIPYLEHAIEMAKAIHSDKRFFFQSKLAGIHFYKKDFKKSKQLAMDIVKFGRDMCDEDMFYYYAARSFIKLGDLDSAYWVKSIIPHPLSMQDSFNYFLLQTDLAKARHDLHEYERCRDAAEALNQRIVENPANSRLRISEINFDAALQQTQLSAQYKWRSILVLVTCLIVLLVSLYFTAKWMKGKVAMAHKELMQAKREIEDLMESSQSQISALQKERNDSNAKLIQMNKDYAAITKKYQSLEMRQADVHEIAADIVRERNAALRVLYQEIRMKIKSLPGDKTRSITLYRLIQDFHESRIALSLEPQAVFWEPLKSSIDHEFNGIATFMIKKYPQLSAKDHHLFWLLCANVSPNIIKLCMNYTTAVTVSNNKRRLIKEKIGLNVKFEEFIQMYLNGDLG